MNKKLRLLVTDKCHNKCPLCCNNSWDFSKLPVVDRWDYDEIMITGGEPLLKYIPILDLIDSIRGIHEAQGHECKIYIYTAFFDVKRLKQVSMYSDGIVLTPHKIKDIDGLLAFNDILLKETEKKYSIFNYISFRLNLFPDIKKHIPEGTDLHLWTIKDMQWIKDCPVPEGEDFRRIKNLY